MSFSPFFSEEEAEQKFSKMLKYLYTSEKDLTESQYWGLFFSLFYKLRSIIRPRFSKVEFKDFIRVIHLSDNANGIVIECEDCNVPCDSRNLCYKVAQQYADYANIIPSWKIVIEKNIPIAAGMGGGSSNAATVLNILQEKYFSRGGRF